VNIGIDHGAHNIAGHRVIQVARELLGMTQAELATAAGCSASRISRIENGTLGATPAKELLAICHKLRLAPEAVIEDGDTPQMQPDWRWRGRLTLCLQHNSTWDQLANGLAYCAYDMAYYHPEVLALGQIVLDHKSTEHMLYYGERHPTDITTGPRKRIVIPPTTATQEYLDRVAKHENATIKHYTGRERLPVWVPITRTEVWVVSQRSQHGVLLLYCGYDPAYTGDYQAMAVSCASLLDRAIEAVYTLDEIGGSRISDLERRMRKVEQMVRRK
jgi:transcriptional regulator with XRE-family HTH domain